MLIEDRKHEHCGECGTVTKTTYCATYSCDQCGKVINENPDKEKHERYLKFTHGDLNYHDCTWEVEWHCCSWKCFFRKLKNCNVRTLSKKDDSLIMLPSFFVDDQTEGLTVEDFFDCLREDL